MINTQTANKNHYVQTFSSQLINDIAHQHQQQANQTNQRSSNEPVKTMPKNQVNHQAITEQSQRIRRNFVIFVHIYAILTISLYVTYAAYYFYQHQLRRNQHQQQQFQAIDISPTTTPEDLIQMSQSEHQHMIKLTQSDSPDDLEQRKLSFESKFESKVHLLERYIELIAIDLQETKNRLKEREKCDCSLSCYFNGTRYAEHSSWQSQCDVCTCQSGRISCLPKKCPTPSCDDAIQLAGQCCPTCMKKCKYNNTIVRHGHKFKPSESSGKSTKECKCHDGLIKCELPTRGFSTALRESKPPLPTNSTLKEEEASLGVESKRKQSRTATTLETSNSTNLVNPSSLTHPHPFPLPHKAQPPLL